MDSAHVRIGRQRVAIGGFQPWCCQSSLRSWIFRSPVPMAGDNAAFLWRRGFPVIASLHANTFAVIIVLWGLIKKTLKSKFLR